jgi:hypothetical protein
VGISRSQLISYYEGFIVGGKANCDIQLGAECWLEMYEDKAERPAPQWTIHNIEALSGSEEGAYLEFKKATEFLNNGQYVKSMLTDELAETVSAFLNAYGGTILLGVQTVPASEDRKKEYLNPYFPFGLKK